MAEAHRHPTGEPWPLPRLARPRRHTGFTMIPDGAGLAGREVCEHTGTDGQTDDRRGLHIHSQPRPARPHLTHWALALGAPAAPACSVQEEGDRNGKEGAREGGGGQSPGADEEDCSG